jgi:hypothetical protein
VEATGHNVSGGHPREQELHNITEKVSISEYDFKGSRPRTTQAVCWQGVQWIAREMTPRGRPQIFCKVLRRVLQVQPPVQRM